MTIAPKLGAAVAAVLLTLVPVFGYVANAI